jgi:transcriptional regulator with XRE-family HTH domain
MKKRIPLAKVLNEMNQRGINRTALSFYSGIELSRLSRILNGWLMPSERDRKRISQALNAPEDVLFANETI